MTMKDSFNSGKSSSQYPVQDSLLVLLKKILLYILMSMKYYLTVQNV